MLSQNIIRKSLATCLAVAVWSVSSMAVALAAGTKNSGELTATGQVTVNGQSVSGSTTIVSGSTINTSENSSAVVSLGKLGRLEISQTASLSINFSETAINISLDSGRVKVNAPQGVSARVISKDGTVSNETAKAAFAVTVECSFTNVETQSGVVSVSSSRGTKQVAAGTETSLGIQQTDCKPCLRPVPGGGKVPALGFGGAGLLGLLLAGGAAVGTAVVIGTSGGNSNVSTGGTIISPTR